MFCNHHQVADAVANIVGHDEALPIDKVTSVIQIDRLKEIEQLTNLTIPKLEKNMVLVFKYL